jgi:hypothetical protein
MDGAFTPSYGIDKGNITGPSVFNGPLNINIGAKLFGYPNILKVALYTLLLAIEHTKLLTTNTFISTLTTYTYFQTLLDTQHPNTIEIMFSNNYTSLYN